MTRTEQNIIEHWELMGTKDIGLESKNTAWEFSKIFRQIFEEAEVFGEEYPLQVKGFRSANKFIREFIYAEGISDECSVTECCDLNHIDITVNAAHVLDTWLMTRKGWFLKYKYALSI